MTTPEVGFEEMVEKRAAQLVRENYPGADDLEVARMIARRMLQESEERVADPSAHDHEHDGKIRRSSRETAADGRSGMRAAQDGE